MLGKSHTKLSELSLRKKKRKEKGLMKAEDLSEEKLHLQTDFSAIFQVQFFQPKVKLGREKCKGQVMDSVHE